MPIHGALALILTAPTLAQAPAQAPAPAPPPAASASAADVVTLRDGKLALGQVVEPAPRGKVVLIIRRAWAQEHLPDWLKKWEAAEAAWAPKARRERRERLLAWKRERTAAPDAPADDRIVAWLDKDIDALRLQDQPDSPRPPLMAVQLGRADVRATTRRPKDVALLLRQGWRAGFRDVEELPVDELRARLEGRGYALSGEDPAPVDRLLPVMPETEAHWLARRAATEVTHDPGLRFVRYQGLVMPEGTKDPTAGLGALVASLKNLLGDAPADDPLAAKFREVGARGRAGLVVTKLDMAPDFASVTVESTLFVRLGRDRWQPATTRSAVVRPDAMPAAEGKALAADPQVQEALKLVESLGLGSVPDDVKARSLNTGAATQKALAQARAVIERDLETLALPVP